MHIALWGVMGIHGAVVLAACGLLWMAGAPGSAWGLAGLGVVGAGGLLACVYPPWLRPLHKLRASLRNRPSSHDWTDYGSGRESLLRKAAVCASCRCAHVIRSSIRRRPENPASGLQPDPPRPSRN